MKKLSGIGLFILSFFVFCVNARAYDGVMCNINDSSATLKTCNYVLVESLTNVNNIMLIDDLEVIELAGVNISDITFLNQLDFLDVLYVRDSNINLNGLNTDIGSVGIFHSFITNDDLSSFANSSSLFEIVLDGSFIKDLSSLESLKNLSNLKHLSINELGYSIIDLTPITKLPNLTDVDMLDMEHNATQAFINYVSSNGITLNTSISNGPSMMSSLKQILKDLDIENASDEEIVSKITLYVANLIDYDLTKAIAKPRIEVALTGKGVCAHYALLENALLNLAGFSSYIITGYAGAEYHAWNVVYLNGSWLAIDATWLSGSAYLTNVANMTPTTYYLENPNGAFKTLHNPDLRTGALLTPSFKVDILTTTGDVITTKMINGYGVLPALARPNFVLNGLYTDMDLTNEFGTDTLITRDMALYSDWHAVASVNSTANDIENPATGSSIITGIGALALFGIGVYLLTNNKRNFYRV